MKYCNLHDFTSFDYDAMFTHFNYPFPAGMMPCFFIRVMTCTYVDKIQTRMWANAQRDGRPACYRWRPLFNAAVWLTPTTSVPCSNAARRETR